MSRDGYVHGGNAPQPFDTTGQIQPPGMRPRLTTSLSEEEGALCFQVDVNGICVARREGLSFSCCLLSVGFETCNHMEPSVLTPMEDNFNNMLQSAITPSMKYLAVEAAATEDTPTSPSGVISKAEDSPTLFDPCNLAFFLPLPRRHCCNAIGWRDVIFYRRIILCSAGYKTILLHC